MNSTKLGSTILVILFSFAACTFKATAVANNNLAPGVSGDVRSVVFQMAQPSADSPLEVKRDLKQAQDGTFSNDDPLIIPFGFGGPVKLKLLKKPDESDEDFADLQASGFWSTDSEGKYSTLARVDQTHDYDGWVAQIELPPNWASQNEEAHSYLQLSLTNGNHKVVNKLALLIATPPTKLSFVQMVPPTNQIVADQRTLATLEFRADLIQTLQVHNDSWYPIEVRTPVEISGKLVTHFFKQDLNQRLCGFTVGRTDWDDVLATEFYLLPLTDDLSSQFRTIIDSGLKNGGIINSIQPGSDRTYGIYASGTGSLELAIGTYPRPTLTTTPVTSSCKARCRTGWAASPSSEFVAYWGTQGWPGTSQSCKANMCSAMVPATSDLGCNDCYEFDAAQNLPHDNPHRACMGYVSGNPWGQDASEPWVVQKIMGTTQVGTQGSQILLELDSQNKIEAAYPHADNSEAKISQSFSSAFVTQSIQAE